VVVFGLRFDGGKRGFIQVKKGARKLGKRRARGEEMPKRKNWELTQRSNRGEKTRAIGAGFGRRIAYIKLMQETLPAMWP